MPRTKRVCPGGMVFHALNRGVGRRKIFATDRDYLAFEETVEETLRFYPMRILGYCWLPNHWHFVLWPEADGQLSAFLGRLTNTHTQRWQRAKQKVGYGHLYQGRFKSFPVAVQKTGQVQYPGQLDPFSPAQARWGQCSSLQMA